ncbi:DUF6344 domain-containing protein [Streptomyces sp. KL116D]
MRAEAHGSSPSCRHRPPADTESRTTATRAWRPRHSRPSRSPHRPRDEQG